jgi:hypothetical protein
MAIDALLERRTLIAAINDPALATESMFFIDNFFGAPRRTFSSIADIRRTKGKRGLARFRNSGQAANVVGRVGEEILTIRMPFIREKKPIEAAAIINPKSLGEVYVTGGEGIATAKRQAIATDLADLKNRILRREEWMASQILTTGMVRYADDYTSFEIDFEMPVDNMPVLSGTSLWDNAASDVLANLRTWSKLIQRATGRPGARVIMGELAAEAFIKHAQVQNFLNTLNLPSGRLTLDATGGAATLGTFAGFTFSVHSQEYEDENGDSQNYMPTNGVLMLPNNFGAQRLFGVIEEIGGVFADPFFSKTYEEQDPSVMWMLAASRPLPIVEEAGSWVYAEVLAAV